MFFDVERSGDSMFNEISMIFRTGSRNFCENDISRSLLLESAQSLFKKDVRASAEIALGYAKPSYRCIKILCAMTQEEMLGDGYAAAERIALEPNGNPHYLPLGGEKTAARCTDTTEDALTLLGIERIDPNNANFFHMMFFL